MAPVWSDQFLSAQKAGTLRLAVQGHPDLASRRSPVARRSWRSSRAASTRRRPRRSSTGCCSRSSRRTIVTSIAGFPAISIDALPKRHPGRVRRDRHPEPPPGVRGQDQRRPAEAVGRNGHRLIVADTLPMPPTAAPGPLPGPEPLRPGDSAWGRRLRRVGLGWLMVSPPVLVMVVFIGIPVVSGILFSLGYTGGANSMATHAVAVGTAEQRQPTFDVFAKIFSDPCVRAGPVGDDHGHRRHGRGRDRGGVGDRVVRQAVRRAGGARFLTGIAIVPLFIPVVIGAYAIRNFYLATGFWGSAGKLLGLDLSPLSYHTSGHHRRPDLDVAAVRGAAHLLRGRLRAGRADPCSPGRRRLHDQDRVVGDAADGDRADGDRGHLHRRRGARVRSPCRS